MVNRIFACLYRPSNKSKSKSGPKSGLGRTIGLGRSRPDPDSDIDIDFEIKRCPPAGEHLSYTTHQKWTKTCPQTSEINLYNL